MCQQSLATLYDDAAPGWGKQVADLGYLDVYRGFVRAAFPYPPLRQGPDRAQSNTSEIDKGQGPLIPRRNSSIIVGTVTCPPS